MVPEITPKKIDENVKVLRKWGKWIKTHWSGFKTFLLILAVVIIGIIVYLFFYYT